MEKTIKELQKELIDLGFSEKALAGIKTKEALLAIIDSIKAKPVTTLNPPVDPKEQRTDEQSWQNKADRMAKHLETQLKVRVLIPLDAGEKVGKVRETMVRGIRRFTHVSGAVWSKTFNGYRVIYPKGTYIPVPEQIAKNIADEHDQTQSAGEEFKIDRVDPTTGRQVREQLS